MHLSIFLTLHNTRISEYGSCPQSKFFQCFSHFKTTEVEQILTFTLHVKIRIYDIGLKPRCKWKLCSSGYYPAHIDTQLPTFRNNPPVASKQSKKMGQICCPETSLTPYQSTERNVTEE